MLGRRRQPRPPLTDIAATSSRPADHLLGPVLAPRLARFVVLTVFFGFCVDAFRLILRSPVGDVQIALSVLFMAMLLPLQLVFFGRHAAALNRSPLRYAVLAVQAGLVYLPVLVVGGPWLGFPSFLAGSVLLTLPPKVAWALFCLITASVAALEGLFSGSIDLAAYALVSTIITGLVVYGLSRLATLTEELHQASDDLAAAAVAQERLRFARELHDLLGYSLSTIILKLELIQRLMTSKPAEAGNELTEILEISRNALADARSSMTVSSRSQAAPARGADTADAPAPADQRRPKLPQPAMRLAKLIVIAVLSAYCLLIILNIIRFRLDDAKTALAVGSILATVSLHLLYFGRHDLGIPQSPARYAVLLTEAALMYLPILMIGEVRVTFPGLVAAGALLTLTTAVAWPTFGLIIASATALEAIFSRSLDDALYVVLSATLTGLAVYGLTRLAALVAEVAEARVRLAAWAVAQERLRFARDLHDLLGYSLSAITLKTELTTRLTASNPTKARTELAEILHISRQALADVRAVATGERELSLDAECTSIRSILAAAEITLSMHLGYHDLPIRMRTVLAIVLREGFTNILRHSKAEHCTVTGQQNTATLTITITNDGVPPHDDRVPPHDSAEPAIKGGSGLQNLANRVAALGGHLTAGQLPDGKFQLHATLPIRDLNQAGQPAAV